MLILLIVLLLFFGCLSLPVGIALGLATMLTLVLATNIDPIMVTQCAVAGLDSFTLMAIPFFMLAGNFMRYGGISRRLLNLADNIVGFFTGGLGAITTVTAMFFAAISGSIGVIIPPSIPFVIYGVATETSIGDLFKAGFIPGILLGVAILVYNYFVAKKNGWIGNGRRFNFRALWVSFKEAFWALLSPVIILGGIYSGYFTPTEAAAVSCVYTFIIGTFVYKEIRWQEFKDCMMDTIVVAGATTFAVGMATSFSYILTLEQIPVTVSSFVLSLTENKILILLAINLFLMVVGMFMDNICSCTILAPILLPVVASYGVDPVHFGIFMSMNLAIGFITPPYGANLFVGSAIGKIPFQRIVKWIWGFIAAAVIVLLVCTYFPQLFMWMV